MNGGERDQLFIAEALGCELGSVELSWRKCPEDFLMFQ